MLLGMTKETFERLGTIARRVAGKLIAAREFRDGRQESGESDPAAQTDPTLGKTDRVKGIETADGFAPRTPEARPGAFVPSLRPAGNHRKNPMKMPAAITAKPHQIQANISTVMVLTSACDGG
jgi:hypothetical protein